MKLDEYLFKSKKKILDLASETGMSAATLSHLKHRKIIPKLTTAIKLVEVSNGDIRFEDLLPPKDKKILIEWVTKRREILKARQELEDEIKE